MRAISLSDCEGDSEQNELRTLQCQLQKTNQLVAALSGQLNELREQVSNTRHSTLNPLTPTVAISVVGVKGLTSD